MLCRQHLLRNTKQYHALFLQAPAEYKQPQKLRLLLKCAVFSGTLAGSVTLKLALKDKASCHAKNTRLAGLQRVHNQNLSFDWKQFWSYLKPHIWYLIWAVAVSREPNAVTSRTVYVSGRVRSCSFKHTDSANCRERSECTIQIQRYKRQRHVFKRDEVAGCEANFGLSGSGKALALRGRFVTSDFQSACTFFYIYMLSNAGEKIAYQMKIDLFSSIIRQDIAFFDQQRTGEIINRSVNF